MVSTIDSFTWSANSEVFLYNTMQHSSVNTHQSNTCYVVDNGYNIGQRISESSFQASESPWTSPKNFYSLQESGQKCSYPDVQIPQHERRCIQQEMPPDSFRPVAVPVVAVQRRTSSLTSLLATDSWINPSTRNDEKRRQQYGDHESMEVGVTYPGIGERVLNMALVMSYSRERSDGRQIVDDDYERGRKNIGDFEELDEPFKNILFDTREHTLTDKYSSYEKTEFAGYRFEDEDKLEAQSVSFENISNSQSRLIAHRRITSGDVDHRSYEEHSRIPVRNNSSSSLSAKDHLVSSLIDGCSRNICNVRVCDRVKVRDRNRDRDRAKDRDGESERNDIDISIISGMEGNSNDMLGMSFEPNHTSSGDEEGGWDDAGDEVDVEVEVEVKLRRLDVSSRLPAPLISAMRNTSISSTETAVARY